MRKGKIIVSCIIVYVITINGIVHSYSLNLRKQTAYNKALETMVVSQQARIDKCENTYNQIEEERNALLIQLEAKENQLRIVRNDLDTVTSGVQEGTWFMGDGIATAYSPFDNKSGIEAEKNGKTTSLMQRPGPGIIAVDPSKIPYHSEMVVVYADGSIYKGVAGDTGGALRASRGLHVDIYKDTYKQTVEHGIKPVMIFWKPAKEAAK